MAQHTRRASGAKTPRAGVNPPLLQRGNALSQAEPDLPQNNKAAIEDSLLRQGTGTEEMAKRLSQFNRPWSAIPQSDDDNALM